MMTIELIPNESTTPENNTTFIFPQTGQSVRIVMRGADDPWFVGLDVCAVLGTDTRNLPRILEDDERCPIGNVYSVHTSKYFKGLRKDSLLISEPGFYRLVLTSRKPIAKPFQRWVMHEVLPSICHTGGYIHATPEETPEMIMAKALRVADDTIKRQQKQLEAVQPTIEKYNTFLNTEGTLSLTEVAKHFDMTAKQLGTMLRSNDIHWLYRNMKNTNIPTKEAIDEGYAIVVSRRRRDNGMLMSQARITSRGMDELHYLLKK